MIQLTDKPKHISADLNQPKVVSNAGGDPIHIGDKVLKAAESVQIIHGAWIHSDGQTQVAVFDARKDRISELEAAIR